MYYLEVSDDSERERDNWVNRMVIADAYFCNEKCSNNPIPIVSHKHNCKSSSKPVCPLAMYHPWLDAAHDDKLDCCSRRSNRLLDQAPCGVVHALPTYGYIRSLQPQVN